MKFLVQNTSDYYMKYHQPSTSLTKILKDIRKYRDEIWPAFSVHSIFEPHPLWGRHRPSRTLRGQKTQGCLDLDRDIGEDLDWW